MTIASYNDLVTACSNWLFARQDILPRVPEFITLAEAKFNREIFHWQMEKRVTTTLDPNAAEPEFIALPGDIQTMRRVRLINSNSPTNPKPALKYATGFQMDELRGEDDNQLAGTPIWYSLLAGEMEFLPAPDLAYGVEMVYRALLPPLGSANATNWLLLLAPDAYLYGTLMEAAPYLHEDERIPTWATGREGAVKGLNDLNEKFNYGAGPLTIRRVPRRPY